MDFCNFLRRGLAPVLRVSRQLEMECKLHLVETQREEARAALKKACRPLSLQRCFQHTEAFFQQISKEGTANDALVDGIADGLTRYAEESMSSGAGWQETDIAAMEVVRFLLSVAVCFPGQLERVLEKEGSVSYQIGDPKPFRPPEPYPALPLPGVWCCIAKAAPCAPAGETDPPRRGECCLRLPRSAERASEELMVVRTPTDLCIRLIREPYYDAEQAGSYEPIEREQDWFPCYAPSGGPVIGHEGRSEREATIIKLPKREGGKEDSEKEEEEEADSPGEEEKYSSDKPKREYRLRISLPMEIRLALPN